MSHVRKLADDVLTPAGITLNGPNPWDPRIMNHRVFDRVFAYGALGVGESYMDGDWDVHDLPEFFARILRANTDSIIAKRNLLIPAVRARFFNMQNMRRALEVVERHYDLGNDLYKAFLDTSLSYTCGYWENAKTLDEAQEAKHDLICRKIGLVKGMRVLDIGCGWGSFALFAAQKYGVHVVGVTISEQQKAYAEDLMYSKGLKELVEIRLQDYRHITDGPFDAVVSIGMFEHVGRKNYRTYMRAVRSLLRDDGLFLLHTIGATSTWKAPDPWFDRYIFANGSLPSVAQIGGSIDQVFVMKDWHAFGQHYVKTLLAWHAKFEDAWPALEQKYGHLYGGKFHRMWRYYLLSMAGGFRANRVDLWQIVLSPKGVVGGYTSVR